jgi:hypothetical protein
MVRSIDRVLQSAARGLRPPHAGTAKPAGTHQQQLITHYENATLDTLQTIKALHMSHVIISNYARLQHMICKSQSRLLRGYNMLVSKPH